MTIHRPLACILAAIATCAAIGLDREHAVAATIGPATTDATTYFVPPSFDVEIEPLEEPRIAGSDATALSSTPAQQRERFEQ